MRMIEMKIDVTLRITPDMLRDAQDNTAKSLVGHMGTHFDVMNKEFPLDYTERRMIVFDVSNIADREIACSDIDLSKVGPDMFVAFRTGYIDAVKLWHAAVFQGASPALPRADRRAS